ncbi:TIGR03564 family F420-dependent LLM class oxidoreductase [Gordonia sp. DT30]|uniref:TIGR03564 family F420-dependent LLM class oxidoreductase n=1 Tax=unclassified Gordonia (in: high G+C Gram-positive bacteria) TaxID=2657482 RepID=UPI003CE7FCAF
MATGIALPPLANDPSVTNIVDRAIELGGELADLGIDSAWFGQPYSYDALTLAALLGRAVPGLRVGTSAIPIHPRHPINLASAAKTAAAATHDRFELGVALGTPALGSVYGVELPPPAAALRDHLRALRPLLDGSDEAVEGPTLRSAPPLPTAVPGVSAPIPLLVAAMGPRTLAVTGELADGTIPFLAAPAVIREHIAPVIRDAAAAAGRPAPRIVAAVPALATDDVAPARAAARSAASFYETIPSYQRVLELGGFDSAGDVFVIGDEAAVADGLQEYLDAGATDLIVTQTDIVGEETRQRTWHAVGKWAADGH